MPAIAAAPGSSEVSRGSHAAAISGAPSRSAGTAAYVIEIGHITPAFTFPHVMKAAARATCAPGRGSRQGEACRPCSTAVPRSQCHDGSSWTSSMRWPYRSWVRRIGSWCSARHAWSAASVDPASAPKRSRSALAQPPFALQCLAERLVERHEIARQQWRRLVDGQARQLGERRRGGGGVLSARHGGFRGVDDPRGARASSSCPRPRRWSRGLWTLQTDDSRGITW